MVQALFDATTRATVASNSACNTCNTGLGTRRIIHPAVINNNNNKQYAVTQDGHVMFECTTFSPKTPYEQSQCFHNVDVTFKLFCLN